MQNNSDHLAGGGGVQVPQQWVIACETAVDIGGPRKELAYAVFSESVLFPSFEDAVAAIRETGLPLGWIAIEAHRLIDTRVPA